METDFILCDASQERTGKVNTLAHYISLYDDIYCQEIFQSFSMRQYYQEYARANEYLDKAIQCYLRDACRILNLKIYQVELFYDAMDPSRSTRRNGNRTPTSAATSPASNAYELFHFEIQIETQQTFNLTSWPLNGSS